MILDTMVQPEHMLLRRNYFWKGMKPQLYKYVRNCPKCQACNAQVVRYQKGHFDIPKAPMDFISMDLIGEFWPPTSQGYKYTLTVICMLTGFTWCIPIKSKNAEEIVKAYMREVYYKYGGSRKILSDNGTEFKNDLFAQVAECLGMEHKIFTPPFHPQSNGRIEGFHRFLKACLAKHISKTLQWSDVVEIACSAYNFFPNEHSRESPFFLMYGRDARIPLTEILTPRIRYLGTDECILSLEALTEIYHLVIENLKIAREKLDKNLKISPPRYTVGDLVLLRNHTRRPLEPQFKGHFRVLAIKGNQVQLKSLQRGDTRWAHTKDVKYVLPADAVIAQIPNYEKSGCPSTLNTHPNRQQNIQWQLPTTLNTVHTPTNNVTTVAKPISTTTNTVMVLSVVSSIISI